MHRGRIRDGRDALASVVRQILPLEGDRIYMELDPDASDTSVLSVHQDVMMVLALTPYEAGALFCLVMQQEGLFAGGGKGITNIGVCMILAPLGRLTPRERQEAVERLVARGFVDCPVPGEYVTNPLAIRVHPRRDLPARLLMGWNAAKVDACAPDVGPAARNGARRWSTSKVGACPQQLAFDDLEEPTS